MAIDIGGQYYMRVNAVMKKVTSGNVTTVSAMCVVRSNTSISKKGSPYNVEDGDRE